MISSAHVIAQSHVFYFGSSSTCQVLGTVRRKRLVLTFSIDFCVAYFSDENDWLPHTASNGYSYLLTDESYSFSDAREECKRLGGHLAYIGMRDSTVYR